MKYEGTLKEVGLGNNLNRKKVNSNYREDQKRYTLDGSSEYQFFFENLIWGIDDVCTFSKYAKGTIYNLVSKGEIPHRTRGRKKKLVFVPSEVIAWLKGD
ncbi:MAG: helix-turn-helix transcriptional regulator [Bacteriovoracia bacterium]